MKISKRLQTIADLIDTQSVIDVGCDHALLDIYLTKEKNLKCTATDISPHVIKQAQKNIEKYQLQNKIQVIQTDGLVDVSISTQDTIILAGMGTSTILDILKTYCQNNPIIICSHKDLFQLRKKMHKKGYSIFKEEAILEKNHWYVVILFKKGKQKYSYLDYLLGPLAKNNSVYLKYLYQKNQTIIKRIPKKHWINRWKKKKLSKQIKKLILVKKNLF